MTESEYEPWFKNKASGDCSLVTLLTITYTGGTQEQWPKPGETVCDKMNAGVDASQIDEVLFEGVGFSALDKRQGSNIIREYNDGGVPKEIKRPNGS